jgi:hypothetical protein
VWALGVIAQQSAFFIISQEVMENNAAAQKLSARKIDVYLSVKRNTRQFVE